MKLKTVKLFQNDIAIDNGQTQVLTDRAALAQRLENRLKMWKGEWFLDRTKGIDYLGLFNSGNYFLQRRFNLMLRKELLADEYVQKVITVDTTFIDGDITAAYTIESTFGEISGTV